MKIAMAQLNPTVGDIEGNLNKICDTLSKFYDKADLVVFPELFIVGYPPRDILERPELIEKADKAIDRIVKFSKKYHDTGIIIGAPSLIKKAKEKKLYNSAILISGGKVLGVQHKTLLPVYDVFDETRYFHPAEGVKVIPFKGEKLGISVCEDMWNDPELFGKKVYNYDPIGELARKKASIMINISASPFFTGKEELRFKLVKNHAKKYKTPFLFVNQVGGNDELVFDGRSVFVGKNGEAAKVFPAFSEHIDVIDTTASGVRGLYKPEDRIATVYNALVLGIRDYVYKCGFSKAVIGLSGGIDSSIVCVLAKEAVGSKNVLGVAMPSVYSAEESTEYAQRLAKNLDIRFHVVPINDVYDAYLKVLENVLGPKKHNDVEIYLQNIQARIRGNILMAFSNKEGYLVLTTGNKSEISVGYCTLYGDMAGGLAVISDVPKKMIYQLAEYINRKKEIIPGEVIKRAPTAELKPDQLDQDTLPPYEILDEILHDYIENGLSAQALINKGFEPATVKWVTGAVRNNEYKRRQAPPCLKVTTKAFGMGRRMPIAAKYDV
ncbi:MAG: NAD+ synthase [Candidatus Omnitrophica bacterium]|nr:NAD+ synthase [Candidatus Omnitrophota bacterium]